MAIPYFRILKIQLGQPISLKEGKLMQNYESSDIIPPLLISENFSDRVLWKNKTYIYLKNFWSINKSWKDFEAAIIEAQNNAKRSDALIIIKRFIKKYKVNRPVQKSIKREYLYIHPDNIPCSLELEYIIKNKKIKIEYID